MKIKAIGLSGYAGSGKSEVAKYLEKTYACTRRHVAEPLRAMLRPLLAAYGFDDNTIWAYLEGPLKEQVISELGVSGRELQITLGTEWGRNLVSDNLWADAWRIAADGAAMGDVSVNDSVRFPNEARAIEDLGGFVIRVNRPGVGPAKFKSSLGKLMFNRFGVMSGVHPSERIDLVPYCYEIENNGSLEELYDQVDTIMDGEHFYVVQKKTSPLLQRLPLPSKIAA